MSLDERPIRAEEEERLRRELQEAREAFEHAHREREAAVQGGVPLDAGNPDGHYAFQRSGVQYRAALERYTIALRNLSDFLLKR